MTKKRFMLDDAGELIDLTNHKFLDYGKEVCDELNRLNNENEQLKQQLYEYREENECQKKENEELKQELFESEKEYYYETYRDNPIRRDAHVEMLKEEFKERFGRDFE